MLENTPQLCPLTKNFVLYYVKPSFALTEIGHRKQHLVGRDVFIYYIIANCSGYLVKPPSLSSNFKYTVDDQSTNIRYYKEVE